MTPPRYEAGGAAAIQAGHHPGAAEREAAEEASNPSQPMGSSRVNPEMFSSCGRCGQKCDCESRPHAYRASNLARTRLLSSSDISTGSPVSSAWTVSSEK